MKRFVLIVLLCVAGCNYPTKYKMGDSVIIKANKKIGVIDGYSPSRGQAYIVKYGDANDNIVSEDVTENGLLPAPE